MSAVAEKPRTVESFLAWAEGREGRYEFVGGLPVRMQAGASGTHDDIVVNILTILRSRLRGSPCKPFTAGFAVKTVHGKIRRPDDGVDCRKSDARMVADEPVLVVEVLSPSTRDFDRAEKLSEYKEVETLRSILYIEPNAPDLYVFERDGGTWTHFRVMGLDATVAVPAVDIQIPLFGIYEGVDFPAFNPYG